MRSLNRDSAELGGSLTVIGNGTAEEAAIFFDAQLEREIRLLTDPDLSSYKAMELRRSLYSVSQPKTYFAGFRLGLRGGRGSKRQGDSLQQGGAFVITPDHEVPFSFFSTTPEEQADNEDILEALRSLDGKTWGWNH